VTRGIRAWPLFYYAADCAHAHGASARMRGARFLKRVFDIERCPRCGDKLKSIAAIEESVVIERILTHLELCASRRHAHRCREWNLSGGLIRERGAYGRARRALVSACGLRKTRPSGG